MEGADGIVWARSTARRWHQTSSHVVQGKGEHVARKDVLRSSYRTQVAPVLCKGIHDSRLHQCKHGRIAFRRVENLSVVNPDSPYWRHGENRNRILSDSDQQRSNCYRSTRFANAQRNQPHVS